ncbi:MAG: hypothetical protein NTZ51_00630 [Proteobacteria bacterium]|nr:hypothetical protein [Pseudomonadota bacterium]
MKSSFRMYVIVFCIAWSTLALELLQTRVLSALYYNNVVYLAVTVALMGFGISGVLVSIFSRNVANPEQLASLSIGLFAITCFVCTRIASFLPVLYEHGSTLVKLLCAYFLFTIPFLFSGCALGLIFMTYGRDIYRLYFVDLGASALGAFCFALLLRPLGADVMIWVVSGVALSGFILYARASQLSKRYIFSILPLYVLGLIVWGGDLLNDQPIYYKFAGEMRRQNARVEHSEWTTIAKIDIWSKNEIEHKTLTQDGCAPTAFPSLLYRETQLLNQMDPGSVLIPQSIPYFIRPKPEDVLVIGPGGGQEIVLANTFGAQHIDAAEINPATVDLVKGPYREFLEWPKYNNLTLYNAEGRHFVKSADKLYDVISMTGVDTFTALNTGAYVLSENYLYTVEAIEDYLNSLKPDGTMLIVRLLFPQPREALRLANLFMYAAEREGIQHPSQCIMVVGWYFYPTTWGATLFKKKPFTPEEVETILRRLKGQQYLTAVYIPNVFSKEMQQKVEDEAFSFMAEDMKPSRVAYNRLIRAGSDEDRRAFEKEYLYNIAPVFDDRPFFFEYHKVSEMFTAYEVKSFFSRGTIVHYVLFVLLILTTAISFLAMIIPLYIFEKEGLKVERIWPLLGFFSSLGIGFMFIELGFIQKLSLYLGHPMYTLTVVLAGILLFTGIGSYYAGTKNINRDQLLKRGMIGTAVISLVWLVVIKYLIQWTFDLSLWFRISITLISLFPVGMLLGIPFATGLRYLEERYPRFIPWAWGVNGLTSVMGSVLAIILAMRVGFTVVIVLGCIVYILGFISMVHHLRDGRQVF